MKKRSVAILLALFLGGFGAHKFYLDQPGRGVMYLLFCWTGIPSLLALFSLVKWLFMGNEKFTKMYGAGVGSGGDTVINVVTKQS